MLQLFTAFKITFSVKLEKPGVHLWQMLYASGCVEANQVLPRCCHNKMVYFTMRVVSKETKLSIGSFPESEPFIFTGY